MDLPKRKNIRLLNFDYSSAGGYFVTLCTQDKKQILSRITEGTAFARARVELTPLGEIAQCVMQEMSGRYGFYLDAFVIMPNHIHMLLIRQEESDRTLGQWIGAFKSMVTNRWCHVCDRKGITAGKIWQRNYYDHILRNEWDHAEKRRYIDENPDKWCLDTLFIP